MNEAVPFVMFGWIPAVFALFMFMQPRRAIIVAFIGAWLFLPVAGYTLKGLPDYTKMSATSVGVLMAAVLLGHRRFLSLRLSWIDIPMAIWCAVPLATSLSNGLGVYDGLSGILGRMIKWGLPYFIGRLYFRDKESLRELVWGIFIGGAIYMPLCLLEVRLSPQLHRWVYGYHQHSFRQTYRLGGFRPMVFMQHGLAVGMWMAAASLAAMWLWRLGRHRTLYGVPVWLWAAALIGTLVLCKSINSLVLFAGALGVLFVTEWTRTRLAMVLLLLVPVTYMALRTTQTWSGHGLTDLARVVSNERRAQSLESRLVQENLFSAKARRRPIFGWGGWNRMFPVDESTGRRLTRGIDSLWIIALGTNGFVGLLSWSAALLLPPLVTLWRLPARYWVHPAFVGCGVLTLLLILHVIDCLFNGMFNPVFVLAAGALGGYAAQATVQAQQPHARLAPVRSIGRAGIGGGRSAGGAASR